MTATLVFLALGSTAFAAGSLARNSVGSAQIKNGGVASADIRSNAVNSGKIKNGTVAGADVADSGLTGRDVADGSVTGDDLADASIGGRKIAGNSVGLQAIEKSTQDFLTDVPFTQVLPTAASDIGLTVNAQPVMQWVTTPNQVGLNSIQSQVNVRATVNSVSVTCELVVDGTVVTRVRETIAKTESVNDYATVPLTTTARLTEGAKVATQCNAGQAFRASAVTSGTDTEQSLRPTTMLITRLAR